MLKKFFNFCAWLSIVVSAALAIVIILVSMDLPDVGSLQHISYQQPMRIYTIEKNLIAEFGHKNRKPIGFNEIPPVMIQAIVATEDRRFYDHPGIDMKGLIRASIDVIQKGEKTQGASTITMQVARNFFLHRKKSWLRKIKELVLAIQIEQFYNKNQILNLYFNKIYFGNHAYGVQAASYNYYGKDISDLQLHEYAMLAGLPKAPSAANPLVNLEKALNRRNYVLKNMLEEKYISQQQYEQAIQQPSSAKRYYTQIECDAPYAADLVRQYLVKKLGQDAYSLGLHVTTTIQKKQQQAAAQVTRSHIEKLQTQIGPQKEQPHHSPYSFHQIKPIKDHIPTYLLHATEDGVFIQNNQPGSQLVPWKTLLARIPEQHHKTVQAWQYPLWQYTQLNELAILPENNAALITIHAHSGAVTSLVGGINFNNSSFNRATSAWRQIGSIIKPLILSAGLSQDLTLADQINDSPVVMGSQQDLEQWRPNNVDFQFRGMTSIREGVVKSRNLVMVRLLTQLSMPKTIHLLGQFGFDKTKQNQSASLALGSGLATPAQVAAAYTVFLNKGSLQPPYLISAIQSHENPIVLPHEKIAAGISSIPGESLPVLNEQQAYIVYDVLKEVVQHGTARRVKSIKRTDLIGKTGTTNQQRDAWFLGGIGPFVTAVWVGNDRSLPIKRYGSQTAIPLWLDYVKSWQPSVAHWEPERPNCLISKKVSLKKDAWYFELFENKDPSC